MQPARSAAVASMIAVALAGCASQTTRPTRAKPKTTASTLPGFRQEERGERAFEDRLRAEYMTGKNRGYLRAATVRFRTPCNAQGGDTWKCEGWGVEALGDCFVATAMVNAAGVMGSIETNIVSAQESGADGAYDVCNEGTGEGQPFGLLHRKR